MLPSRSQPADPPPLWSLRLIHLHLQMSWDPPQTYGELDVDITQQSTASDVGAAMPYASAWGLQPAPCHTAWLCFGIATPSSVYILFMLLSLFFLEIVAGLLMSRGFEHSWVLGLEAVGSSCQAVMSSYVGKGAILRGWFGSWRRVSCVLASLS